MRALDLLEMLKKNAEDYVKQGNESVLRNRHMNKLPSDDAINREQVEAVVVDFINYVARSHWIDYALYTSDLKGDEGS